MFVFTPLLVLIIVGLSEIPLRDGLLGETFANMVGLHFSRLKLGDRFWHETDDPIAGFTNGE